MNHKQRDLELFAIQWDYDMSNIDQKNYEKLEDQNVREDEPQYKPRKDSPTKKGPTTQQPDNRAKTACCDIF